MLIYSKLMLYFFSFYNFLFFRLLADWENETNILADFYFFDASGTEISHCQNIEIPLKRNHETVLRGFFLTRKIGDGNNVNIDDNFGGEYVVEIN